MTLDDLKDVASFMTDGMASQGRKIVIMTGTRGLDMISHAMTVENSVGFVEWMEEKGKVDSDTAKNLIAMLKSKDIENFNIAILAIEQLKK